MTFELTYLEAFIAVVIVFVVGFFVGAWWCALHGGGQMEDREW